MSATMAFFIPFITKGRGGTESVGQMMANAMARRGHVVHVLTSDAERRDSEYPLTEGIRLYHLPEAEDRPFMSRALVALAQCDPDVIIGLHMNRCLLTYLACAMRLGKPFVLSEHIDPKYPERIGTFTSEERVMALTGATRVHLLAERFKQELPDFIQRKVSVIPNTTAQPTTLADPVGPQGDKRIICITRLVPRKNLARLIHAFAIAKNGHSDWKLVLVGNGIEMESLKATAAQLGVSGEVDFVGQSNEPERHLRQAQIFCLPSVFEGFPLSSLEAMAHGLPLLGYRICNGLGLQIDHGVNGLLSKGGVTMGSLATDLRELMRNDTLRARMGEASSARFKELFSPSIVEPRWEQLFLSAARETSAPSPSPEDIANAMLHRYVFRPEAG